METSAYTTHATLEENHFWFLARKQIIKKVLSKFIDLNNSRELKVLEIGAGTGGNLIYFSKYFDTIIGVEMEELARDLAKQKILSQNLDKKLSIIYGKLPNEINFSHNSFDVILLLDVLEHVEDDKASLQTIFNLLKPNGIAVISVPAFMFMWSEHDVLNHHFRRYTSQALKKVIADSGLQIKLLNYFFISLFFPMLAVRSLQKISIFKKQKITVVKPVNPIINSLVKNWLALEKFIVSRIKIPFGTSLVAVLQAKK
ncbi:MAG: class I SAM-dependent methyltransferase [Alphaproteobacteria bacterium]|nr:class I SAM-dependent methyltransferase [Alphaproteobacteria bacterium]